MLVRVKGNQIDDLPLSLRARFIRGVFWSLAGAVISSGLNLIASIIVARIIGKISFGELGIIQSTVGTFSTFAGLGLGLTASKYVAEYRRTDAAKVGRIIVLSLVVTTVTGCILTLLLFAFSSLLATETLKAPHLSTMLRIASLMLLLGALNGVQTGVLAGLEEFRTIAKVNLIQGLCSFPITFFSVWFRGLQGAVWALVATLAIGWLLNLTALRIHLRRASIRLDFRRQWSEWRVLWSFSLPAFLNAVVTSLAVWTANTMLVRQPGGYGEFGVFNAASQWRAVILFAPAAIGTFTLPLLSSLLGEKRQATFRKMFWSNLGFTTAIALLPAIVVASFSPWIIAAYGSDFSQGFLILCILVSVAVLQAISSVIGQAIISTGAMWWALLFNGLWALTLIGLTNLWLAPYQALGLAGAYFVAYLAHTVWQSFYLIRFNKAITRLD